MAQPSCCRNAGCRPERVSSVHEHLLAAAATPTTQRRALSVLLGNCNHGLLGRSPAPGASSARRHARGSMQLRAPSSSAAGSELLSKPRRRLRHNGRLAAGVVVAAPARPGSNGRRRSHQLLLLLLVVPYVALVENLLLNQLLQNILQRKDSQRDGLDVVVRPRREAASMLLQAARRRRAGLRKQRTTAVAGSAGVRRRRGRDEALRLPRLPGGKALRGLGLLRGGLGRRRWRWRCRRCGGGSAASWCPPLSEAGVALWIVVPHLSVRNKDKYIGH